MSAKLRAEIIDTALGPADCWIRERIREWHAQGMDVAQAAKEVVGSGGYLGDFWWDSQYTMDKGLRVKAFGPVTKEEIIPWREVGEQVLRHRKAVQRSLF